MARYYRADIGKNQPVSTEITGYFASTMVFLSQRMPQGGYLNAAVKAADYLCQTAWNEELETFPFEDRSNLAYFFDCGIIIRGLLAVWRVTKEQRLLDTAIRASHGMIRDFRLEPIISLPDKTPLPRQAHWSRSPGCYQLKSALAWFEVSEITGDGALRDAYFEVLDSALGSHLDFLPGAADKASIMDRLHPYLYFLEGLTPVITRPDCAATLQHGLKTVAAYLDEIAPEFVRSDVIAQLMRLRKSDDSAALAEFQTESGAFLFGRRGGKLIPHENPVSTAFAIQALEQDSGSPI